MMSEAKRSGRQARQAERSKKGTGLGRPFIVRNIPTYDVLSEENLIKIERAADRVLAETGIEFRDDPDALQMWRKAGAKVEGLLVKFEPGMLREILKTAPATFTQHARNPAKSVEIGGKSVVFSPAYGSPFVMVECSLLPSFPLIVATLERRDLGKKCIFFLIFFKTKSFATQL